MTEFIINGVKAVLSDDFKFTLIEENPLITKRGVFSLDITFSLKSKINAAIFKHVNRLNNTYTIDFILAELRVDNRIYSGKIIDFQKTDSTITCQFVAGNSEVNFSTVATKIWELDWGTENEITYELALRSINYPGYGQKRTTFPISVWTQKYVCAPVKLITGEILNHFNAKNNGEWDTTNIEIASISGSIIMQPYLMYYVDNLPSLLGYTLAHNDLQTNLEYVGRAKYIYLLNTVDSLNYADALPDITVAEFITYIENYFGVSFIFNEADKTISIKNIYTEITESTPVSYNDFDDRYSTEISSEDTSRFDFTKLSYDFPDTIYHRYQKISDEILRKTTTVEFDNYTDLINSILDLDKRDLFVLYRDNALKNDWAFCTPSLLLYNRWAGAYGDIQLVNKFKSEGDTDKNVFVFNIYPAQMTAYSLPIYRGEDLYGYVKIQIPQSTNSYYIQNEIGLVDTIEGGTPAIPRISKFEVAMYQGRIRGLRNQQTGFNPTVTYPFSTVDHEPEFGCLTDYAYFQEWLTDYYYPIATLSFRIQNLISDYNYQSIIDTSEKYIFKSLKNKIKLSSGLILLYNGVKYVIISIKKTITVKGELKSSEVICYKLK